MTAPAPAQPTLFAPAPRRLLPNHEALVRGSAIAPEVAAARGYYSAETRKELEDLGFSPIQRRVPALVVPVWNVHGEVAQHQIRPDDPRINPKSEKPLKYETIAGRGNVLDVPPAARGWLKDPARPLFVTEGARKADAAVSRGLCCLALLGVWGWRGRAPEGGLAALGDWDAIALKGREVIVVFDSDVSRKDEVRKAQRRLREFLKGRGAKVRVLDLPEGPGGEKVGLDDFFAQGRSTQDLFALSEPQPESRDELPRVVVTTHVEEVVDAAEDALVACDRAELYQRGGLLVRVVRPGAGASPAIAEAPQEHLLELLSRAAQWVKVTPQDDGSERETRILPPSWAVKAFAQRGEWGVRQLAGIIEAPTLRRDGSLVTLPGYDLASGLLFEPSCDFPPIPEAPTFDEGRAALAALDDLLYDFPFLAQCDRVAALAALLTPLVRHAVAGPCPLFAVRATTPGSGKSLVVDLAAILSTGRDARRTTQKRDGDEDAKTILSLALEGERIVLIDNVQAALGSDALDAALTGTEWKGRVLGTTRTASAPLNMVWFATGNNIQVKGDLARRVVPIDLDPGVERPDTRSGFKHPHLLAHARANRGALVAAGLTVIRAYVAAGRPPQDLEAFGSFEAWSALVRSALVWLGCDDPCAGRARLRQDADPELEAWQVFLETWQRVLGPQEYSIVELVDNARRAEELRLAIAATDSRLDPDRLDPRRTGYVFRRWAGRVVSGMRLTPAGTCHGNTKRWKVESVGVSRG